MQWKRTKAAPPGRGCRPWCRRGGRGRSSSPTSARASSPRRTARTGRPGASGWVSVAASPRSPFTAPAGSCCTRARSPRSPRPRRRRPSRLRHWHLHSAVPQPREREDRRVHLCVQHVVVAQPSVGVLHPCVGVEQHVIQRNSRRAVLVRQVRVGVDPERRPRGRQELQEPRHRAGQLRLERPRRRRVRALSSTARELALETWTRVSSPSWTSAAWVLVMAAARSSISAVLQLANTSFPTAMPVILVAGRQVGMHVGSDPLQGQLGVRQPPNLLVGHCDDEVDDPRELAKAVRTCGLAS